jgi:hypothetical protein|uniref:Uncharacterized protein n=1 Tax=viral metagenome TaxID=1070528 RepID=A0A6C0HE84_9ZZZZ
MTWETDKKIFNQRKEQLDKFDKNAIRSLSQSINQSIKQYVNTAGISSNPNENINYIEANKKFEVIIDKEKEYLQLLRELSAKMTEFYKNTDINTKLQTLGKIRNDIVKLEKELHSVKQDADTSRTRKESIEKSKTKISWYQGFASKVGFTKPLHQISIPFLAGAGVLFLLLSGLLLRDFFTTPPTILTNTVDSGSLFSTFSNSRMYSVFAGILLTFIVLGILAYSGYLGKTI